MRELINLVSAAGISVKDLDVLDVFLISGRIINDTEIRRRKAAMVIGSGNTILPADADEQIIASMPPAELAALRSRVEI
jgi:hypothetical protein